MSVRTITVPSEEMRAAMRKLLEEHPALYERAQALGIGLYAPEPDCNTNRLVVRGRRAFYAIAEVDEAAMTSPGDLLVAIHAANEEVIESLASTHGRCPMCGHDPDPL